MTTYSPVYVKGIKIPDARTCISGRVYHWLYDLNPDVKPASCTVQELALAGLEDFPSIFETVGRLLVEGAGVSLIVDAFQTLQLDYIKSRKNFVGDLEVIDSSQSLIPSGYIQVKVGDSLMMKNRQTREKYPDHVSIFLAFQLAFTCYHEGKQLCLDFVDVRDADDISSGKQTFMQVCKDIFEFAKDPTLYKFLYSISSICGTIRRGGFRRQGAVTASIKVDNNLIHEYLDIGFKTLPYLKKGVAFRETLPPFKTLMKLIEKQTNETLFFEKPLGYSKNQELRTNVCLTGDTRVITREGHKSIEELVGQEVEIFDGNKWVKNSNFRCTSLASDVYVITLYDGRQIKATSNHEFVLANGTKKKIKNLFQGDLLLDTNYKLSSTNETKSAYLKGFLLADGCTSDNRAILELYENKYVCETRLITSLEESEIISQTTNTLVVASFSLPRYFGAKNESQKRLQGITSRKIDIRWAKEFKLKLPLDEVLNWGIRSKSEFIAGLFDGDGTAQQGRRTINYVLSSSHKSFLLDVQLLLKTLGVASRVLFHQEAKNKEIRGRVYETKESWRLWLSQRDSKKLSELCQFSRLKDFANDKPLRKTTSPYKGNSVSSIEFSGIEPVYCTFVETTNNFLLSNGIMSGNCRGLGLIHGDQCLITPVNLAACRTFKDIEEAIVQTVQFLTEVHLKQIELGFDLKDKQLGVGFVGLANLLRHHKVSYPEFIEVLTLTNNRIEDIPDSTALEIVKALWEGINQGAVIGRQNKMRAIYAIEPTENASRRIKDLYGFNVAPNIDPPDVVPGVGIEVRHSESGMVNYSGEPLPPVLNYGEDIFPAQALTEQQHFELWVGFQRMFDWSGLGHGGCYEQWGELTVSSFFRWWRSNLKFIYYNRRVGTDHLIKGNENSIIQSARQQLFCDVDQSTLEFGEECDACG